MRIAVTFLALAVAALGLLDASPARAEDPAPEDAIVLRDGRTIRGRIVGEDEGFVSIRSDGVLRAYPKERVEDIRRAPAGPEASAEVDADADGSEAEAAKGAKAAKRADAPKRRDRKAARGDEPAPLTDQARAWLTELLNRMRSPAGDDPAVRASLVSALRALGGAAVPGIRAAAAEADGDVAALLQRVAADIETRGKRGPDAAGATSDRPRRESGTRNDAFARLDLRPEQARDVKGVLREHLRERRTIAKEARDAATPREEVVARLAELRARTLESVRALLDAEQAARLDEAQDELFRAVESRALRKPPAAER